MDEELLKRELKTTTLKPFGGGGGGCISSGQGYDTDHGRVFVKVNNESQARRMFDGEAASLKAMYTAAEVKVPKPIKVFDLPVGGAAIAMEYLDLSGSLSRHAGLLGQQLARLHLKNEKVGEELKKKDSSVHRGSGDLKYIERFGFDVATCCGYYPQDNTWNDDWVKFYARKIEQQLEFVKGDREAEDLWSQILPRLDSFFKDVDVKPALLHGDLWSGNAAADKSGPVIYDPASFYGHSEYDLAIANMFGGFSSAFFQAYFQVIPKSPGYEIRQQLYKLFHYMNHWNHFGGGYRDSSISTMKGLLRNTKI
ncbi:ketosamine-3-kinase-like [Gigantopelta aegis]|uniref:ketosamine-3-kinase-like n=1 Tax=Gigantopelta aegis TaxID=1735272 RepID=UPI001B8895E3|nr:ketosamine-3-kinase-like [Gigantopelta aegis]XP_041350558.1 ketosamine-3-kinase-like [Gigantopelta aegis]XP_041350559.1 ketosamine-3-kinase-like [Gigantopelta aegis]